MIRLRIEKEVKTFSKEGLIFYKGGRPYQVIIEREEVASTKIHPEYGEITAYKWVPVEVIDES